MAADKVLVVTNFAPHYRVRLFELLHQKIGAEFIFFSDGTESYWQSHLGVSNGDYPATFTRGRKLFGNVRLNIALIRELATRDYDVVIKCMNGQAELLSTYVIARLRRKSFVLWTGMWMHPTTRWHKLTRPFADYLYRHADAIVTYGSHVSRFVVTSGAAREKVFVAENAIDNETYSRDVPKHERGLPGCVESDGFTILSVSRLTSEKGLTYLIDAVALLRTRCTLFVVGTGPDAEQIGSYARSAGVDLVLTGGLPPASMPAAYRDAQVFVLPSVSTSLFKEPWGLSVNEAMCQACPVIVTDAVGAAAGGLVIDGDTGLVVPERNAEALAAALERILSDGDFAQGLGSAGKRRVTQTNYEQMSQGFVRAASLANDRNRS